MSSSLPTFSNAALTEAVHETAPEVLGFTQNLDKMSEDIKKLESYLEASAIRVEGWIPVPNWSESIGWSNEWGLPGEHHDRWRIVHAKFWHDDDGDWNRPPEKQCPLIEATVEARLRAYPALPELVRHIAKRATVEVEPLVIPASSQNVASDDDLPF